MSPVDFKFRSTVASDARSIFQFQNSENMFLVQMTSVNFGKGKLAFFVQNAIERRIKTNFTKFSEEPFVMKIQSLKFVVFTRRFFKDM